LAADAWLIVGMGDVSRRTQEHNERLGNAMRALGFERTLLSFDGKTQNCYARGNKAERQQRIYLTTLITVNGPDHGVTGTPNNDVRYTPNSRATHDDPTNPRP